jgi:GNAT superfamily N-acetyltransferase
LEGQEVVLSTIDYRVDPFPADPELAQLSAAAWGQHDGSSYQKVLARSLCHVGAYADNRLIGFVNVAWDGGIHAFILDTQVHPEFQRRGIATQLVRTATEEARRRGAEWLHVDYEPHLESFYRGCGFRPTLAGLIRL